MGEDVVVVEEDDEEGEPPPLPRVIPLLEANGSGSGSGGGRSAADVLRDSSAIGGGSSGDAAAPDARRRGEGGESEGMEVELDPPLEPPVGDAGASGGDESIGAFCCGLRVSNVQTAQATTCTGGGGSFRMARISSRSAGFRSFTASAARLATSSSLAAAADAIDAATAS